MCLTRPGVTESRRALQGNGTLPYIRMATNPPGTSMCERTLPADPSGWIVKNPAHSSGGAAQADPQLIAFVLPGIPESVPAARFHIRAALGFHQLGEYADDAETIASELVTNAIQHACGDGTEMLAVVLMRMPEPEGVTVAVMDSSPKAPVKCEPSESSEPGRGLLIVEELSVYWGWSPINEGKAVYAILAREAGT